MTNQTYINTPQAANKENNLPQTALGITGGAVAGFALRKSFAQFLKPYYKDFIKNVDKFTPQEQEALIQEADKMIKESSIVEKGFKGINWIDASKNTEKNTDIIGEKLKNINSIESFKEFIKEIKKIDSTVADPLKKISADEAINKLVNGILKVILTGSFKDRLKIAFIIATAPIRIMANLLTGKIENKNKSYKQLKESIKTGCFDSLSNRIFTSKPASVLHEIGHAINKNTNFLTKLPDNLALVSIALIQLALLTAIFSRKPQKKDKEQPENKNSIEKLKNFDHKHIGLVVIGLSAPKLVEEGIASFRAIKHVNASKILEETTKKQHNKTLKIAFGSYIIGTAALAAVVKSVVFVKDKISAYKFGKNN